jgi:hypothetical protein
MKTKQRKTIPKTRSHRVEKKPYVPLRECSDAQQYEGRKETNTEKCSDDQKREGDQSCLSGGGRKNKEECEEAQPAGNTENSEESIHPGPLQTLHQLHPQCAGDEKAEKTLVEAEEIPFGE